MAAKAPGPSARGAIDFLTLLGRLKRTPRTGWVRKGVDRPESVADHMYRMGAMALVAGRVEGLDMERCMKLALVHDMAEALVGDITPFDGVTKEEKHAREVAAVEEMKGALGGAAAGEEFQRIWLEYEHCSTPEAQLVKDFDKLEMILQALEYERDQKVDLSEFFDSTAGKFKTALGKEWASEINARRAA